MFLLLDHNDSFLYNLKAYIEEEGYDVLVRPAQETTVKAIESLQPTGLILSPGPGHPSEERQSLAIIEAFKNRLPILGVCLGHQLLAYEDGARIIHGPRPMHGKVTPITHEGQGLFQSLPSPMKVTRYHSLIVDPSTLPSHWHIDAIDDEGVIMGMHHESLPLYSVQFHPEAVFTEHGHPLLRQFCQLATTKEKGNNHGN